MQQWLEQACSACRTPLHTWGADLSALLSLLAAAPLEETHPLLSKSVLSAIPQSACLPKGICMQTETSLLACLLAYMYS